MANESLYTGISQFINIVYEGALRYAETRFVAPQLVTMFSNLRGMETRQVTEYQEKGVTDNLGELDSLDTARVTIDRHLRASLTPKEIGKQVYMTDRRVDTDTENVLADTAREIGYTMGKKMEVDILANLNNLQGGIVGANTDKITLVDVWKARALLEKRDIMPAGGYICILDPLQWLDIQSELTSLSNNSSLSVQEQAMNSYYVNRIADVQFVVSPNIPFVGTANETQTLTPSGSASAGTFRLSFYGLETADMAYNIAAADMEDALEALPTIGAGNVTVALDGGTGVYTVTFVGELAGRIGLPLLVLSNDSITNGSFVIAQTVAGAGYNVGGLFTREAMAFDVRRPLRLEPERKPDLRATVINASAIYATGSYRADYGIKLIGKPQGS